jgi:hypothetical protein
MARLSSSSLGLGLLLTAKRLRFLYLVLVPNSMCVFGSSENE